MFFLIITDNPTLYMFRRRKTGEGVNYAGEKKIEEKYCIFLLLLVKWKLERENKLKKSKLIYLKPREQLKNILLQIYDHIYIYIMEIKKIIALL